MHQISPVAHWPVVLGVVRQLNVAALIDTFCPPHPAPVLACGRGVEALLLAILDGQHALYNVGARLEERGMVALLQPGLTPASRHDDRLGQILDALLAAHRNRVFGAIALNALAIDALPTPWRPQDTTTLTRYGASEDEPKPPGAPRPAYGQSQDGHDALKQVLLRLGVSRDGLPLRMGARDGQTRDSPETPVALEEGVARGLDGVRGMVADRQGSCQRTLGWCREPRVGLITLGPRTCAVRQEVEAWGQQHGALPWWLEKPARPRQEPPRRGHGPSVVRRVPVEDADGRLDGAAIRFRVVHASPLAQQGAVTSAAAPAQEAARVTEHVPHVAARWVAGAADAEAAIAEDEGRGQGRRGRTPRPWRYHGLHDRVEAVRVLNKRTRRGRPPPAEAPQVEVRYRRVVPPAVLTPAADAHGWTVLATTGQSDVCTDAALLQADQEQHSTVEPGLRWIKNPAAIAPVWLEKPARIAALAMLTVVGLLGSAVIQRQVRLYLHDHDPQVPGNKGATATPTAAVVFALLTQVMLGQFVVDNRVHPD
jgi:hypothetical protein